MNWREHWNLKGKHAFLGASQSSWLRYDDTRLINVYQNMQAKEKGTELHALAESMIRNRIKAASRPRNTFSMYVNDAIGFGMTPEVILYYSDNIFGTTDGIRFDEKNNFLRIHDLKTGTTPAHMDQLKIYAALFCLEYNNDPLKLDMELRIYQNNDIEYTNTTDEPDLQKQVKEIMDLIIHFDKVLTDFKVKTGEV